MHAFDSNASTHNIKTERVLGSWQKEKQPFIRAGFREA
jgi:hypothetical protein